MGARLALSAVINKHADPVILVIQALALVEALADCYIAARQARTAAEMLSSSRAALEAISTPTMVSDIEQLRAEAAYQALAGTAGEVQTGDYPAAAASTQPVGEVREPQRELVTAGSPSVESEAQVRNSAGGGVTTADHGLSERQVAQIRNAAALAMPAGGTAPQHGSSAPPPRAVSGTDPVAKHSVGGRASSSEVERARMIYQSALSPISPTASAARRTSVGDGEQKPSSRRNDQRESSRRRQGRRQ